MGSYFRDYYSPTVHQRPVVGDTKMSIASRDHLGWLNCDGRTLNVNNFYQLWEVVGYSFGGSGTQFNLPDMTGRVAGTVGSDGVGPKTWALGDISGEQVHTLTIPEMPSHTHTGTTDASSTGVTTQPHSHTGVPNQASTALNGASNATGDGGTTNSVTVGINDPTHTHTFTTAARGGSLPHQNMQPTLFLGNTFVYSGKPNYGTYPNTINTNLY